MHEAIPKSDDTNTSVYGVFHSGGVPKSWTGSIVGEPRRGGEIEAMIAARRGGKSTLMRVMAEVAAEREAASIGSFTWQVGVTVSEPRNVLRNPEPEPKPRFKRGIIDNWKEIQRTRRLNAERQKQDLARKLRERQISEHYKQVDVALF